jgi:RND family efflux transporter MFP subunit
MTNHPEGESPVSSSTSGQAAPSLGEQILSMGQFLIALVATTLFLVYLLVNPLEPPTPPEERVTPPAEVVTIPAPGRIRVEPGSPFDQKVESVLARKAVISDPILYVTGRVAASLRPGKDKDDDFWQFESADTLTAFADWQKAQADIAFNETQLEQVKELAKTRLEAQKELVGRLQKLVDAGTDTIRDLTAERANLIQTEISGRQEIHQAETALRLARREEAAQARRLQQAGFSLELLSSVTSDVDIVMADVPEARLSQVKVGQACRARFFGLPRERFPGQVKSIAPVLSAERRSLRVLFTIDDPDDKLRPGMFAEIGLGTDEREALLVPADAILHIGRTDYVMVAEGDNTWRVTEVQVGEPYRTEIEILDGLPSGARIISKGAILFKPLVVRSLQLLEADQ